VDAPFWRFTKFHGQLAYAMINNRLELPNHGLIFPRQILVMGAYQGATMGAAIAQIAGIRFLAVAAHDPAG